MMTADKGSSHSMPEAPDHGSDAARPDVSILIVAYNSADLISRCIASITQACTRYACEVLLVDNGDGTTEALVAAAFPNVRVVESRGNIGFAAGNNLLAGHARAPKLLLANPDLEMRPGAIDALLDAAQRYPDAAAWGGVTLNRQGEPDWGNNVEVPTLRELASRAMGRSLVATVDPERFAHDHRADVLMGGFVMIARQPWDEVGGFDERYFLYCEEVDLFFRLSQKGHHFWRIAEARAFHDVGHGTNMSSGRVLFLMAGTMQFARIHWTPFEQFRAFVYLWLAAVIRYVLGLAAGSFKPALQGHRTAYKAIALSPSLWRYGYEPERGLLSRLNKK